MMPTQFKRPNAAADLVMIIMLAAASSVSAWTMGRYFFALAFASAAVVGALKLAESPLSISCVGYPTNDLPPD